MVFNNGAVREVDCSFLLHGTLGEPLRDPAYFRKARVDNEARTVVWPNGLDPAPELLYDAGEAVVPEGPPPDARSAADAKLTIRRTSAL